MALFNHIEKGKPMSSMVDSDYCPHYETGINSLPGKSEDVGHPKNPFVKSRRGA